MAANERLKLSAARASLWSMLQVGWSSAASFIVFAVLVRRLDIADIGMFSLAVSFSEIIKVVAGAGLSDALQRETDLDGVKLDTAFWGGLGLTMLMAAAMALIAPVYAGAVHSPGIVPLIRVLAGLMVINALSRVHWATKLHGFGHKFQTMQSMCGTLLGGFAAIAIVMAGGGVWALMSQVIIGEVVTFAFAWIGIAWRPRFRFSAADFRTLTAFGGGLVLTRLMWTFLARVPDFFIGRYIGTREVGIYRVAWRLVELIGNIFLAPIASVTFIALAKLRDDREAYERAYVRVLGTGSLLMIPVVAGFGATAVDLVPFLFGEHVRESIPIAQILAFSAPVYVTNYFISSALGAVGRPYEMSKIAAVQLASTLLVSILAVPYGILAITVAYVIRGYLTLPYQQVMLHRNTGVRYRRVLDAVGVPIGASAVMVVVCLAVRGALPERLPDPVRLLIDISAGALVYFAAVAMLDRQRLGGQVAFLRSLLGSCTVDPTRPDPAGTGASR